MLEPLNYTPPETPWLPILHADDLVLVIDKPSGLLSVPGNTPALADCLAARAEARYPGTRIVHRLDLDTSGVMVLGRTPGAQRLLSMQFERRQVEKRYIALVHGAPQQDHGQITLPLRGDWENRPLQIVDADRGKPSLTRWTLLERNDSQSRLALHPETGRTHQLRVHLREIGHPILGDRFYAPPDIRKRAPRLMLHAEHLSFLHPNGGTRVAFEAPCPF